MLSKKNCRKFYPMAVVAACRFHLIPCCLRTAVRPTLSRQLGRDRSRAVKRNAPFTMLRELQRMKSSGNVCTPDLRVLAAALRVRLSELCHHSVVSGSASGSGVRGVDERYRAGPRLHPFAGASFGALPCSDGRPALRLHGAAIDRELERRCRAAGLFGDSRRSERDRGPGARLVDAADSPRLRPVSQRSARAGALSVLSLPDRT